MRAAMAAAPVGDDQFGEDPTVNALQERVAALLGKEAALWVPSGTMANQVALRVLTRPGDTVLVSRESHAVLVARRAAAAPTPACSSPRSAAAACSPPPTCWRRAVAPGPRHHAADHARRDREHPQPRRRRRVSAGRGRARVRGGARARHGVLSRRRAAVERRRWRAACRPRRWRRRSTWCRWRSRRGSGAPGGSMLAGSRDLIARGAAAPADVRRRDAAGGHLRRRGRCTRSTITSDSWPTDHANAALLAGRLARARASSSTSRRCRRTSSCSAWPTAHPTRRRWSRVRGSAACCCSRSARARCVP